MKNRTLVIVLISTSVIAVICLLLFFGVAENKGPVLNGVAESNSPDMTNLTQNDGASIKFDEMEHDFGIINETDGSASYTFEFINDEIFVLLIHDVLASCGCTTPEWTKEPVKPGKKGFVTAVYDPNQRPGAFNKSLKILSNARVQQTKLNIKGIVVPIARDSKVEYPVEIGGLRIKYRTVSFETITKEKPVTTSFQVYNDTDKEMIFSDQYKAPDHIKLNFSPQILPSNTVGTIEVVYDPRKIELFGIKSDIAEFKTDELIKGVKKIRIIAFLEEYFPPMSTEQMAQAPILLIENPSHDFGSIKRGESVMNDFVITNTGKSDLIIRLTRASCGFTATKPLKSALKSGESSTINVTFDSTGRSGEQNKVIYVFSNDPINPTQKMTIRASIENEV
jgi:hypothetical protein